MRGVPDEDCGIARGNTSRCLRLMWSCMLTRCWLRSSSCVSALHWWVVFNLMINGQSEYNPGQGVSEAVRTSLRAVRGLALAHWHPGERREGRGGKGKGRRRNCHLILFISITVQKPKPRKSLLKAASLVSVEMKKLSIFVPFVSWSDHHHLLRWQNRSIFKNLEPLDFPGGSESEESACNAADPVSVPGLGKPPAEGNGNPLQCSCLENYMDRGIWWAAIHGLAKSWTKPSD